MADDDLPQNGRVVLIVLQDGRQLEGEMRVMSDGDAGRAQDCVLTKAVLGPFGDITLSCV